MASLDEYLKAKPSGRSVQGPPVAPRQIGNPSPGAKVAIDPDKGFMPFLSPHPTTPAPQGMSGRGRPVPFAVPDSTPRPPQKNPLAFLDAPAPGSLSGAFQQSIPPPQPAFERLFGKPPAPPPSFTSAIDAVPTLSDTVATLKNAQAPGPWAQTRQSLMPPAPGNQRFNREFTNASVPDFTTAKGGYIGARTDAEAAKSLLDSQRQSEAAQFKINQLNTAADALRDTRAAKLGISRGTLDAMEGRGGTWASEGPLHSVGKEGVSFGDEAKRQAEMDGMTRNADSLLADAGRERGWGSGRRAAAKVAAAQALMAPGMAQREQQSEQGIRRQVSADSLAGNLAQADAARFGSQLSLQGHLAQAGASQAGAQAAAQQRAMEAQRQAGMDNARLALDQRKQQLNELTQTNNRAKGEYDLQREADLAKLWESIKALPAGDPRAKALSDQYMLLKRGMEPKQDLISQLGL